MTARRFFIDPEKINGNKAVLAGDDAHHLKNVLRLKTDSLIELLDGGGTIFTARIKGLGKEIDLEIEGKRDCLRPSPSIHIAQGLLKGKKMDFLIQKATELGINGFQPFTSLHGVAVKPSANKIIRWHKIMTEACKQSGRAEFMEIGGVTDFSGICERGNDFEKKIILWENEPENSLRTIGDLCAADSVLVAIGPEGGFCSEEIDQAEKNGFQAVTMGEIILRAESAAFTVMAILQFLTGKLE